MQPNADDFLLRAVGAGDVAYISKSWKSSDYETGTCPWGQHRWSREKRGKYYLLCNAVVDGAIKDSSVLIIVDKFEPDFIVGWICYTSTPRVLHYIYVRKFAQRLGIAKMLLAAAFGDDLGIGAQITHLAHDLGFVGLARKLNWEYKPTLLYPKIKEAYDHGVETTTHSYFNGKREGAKGPIRNKTGDGA